MTPEQYIQGVRRKYRMIEAQFQTDVEFYSKATIGREVINLSNDIPKKSVKKIPKNLILPTNSPVVTLKHWGWK